MLTCLSVLDEIDLLLVSSYCCAVTQVIIAHTSVSGQNFLEVYIEEHFLNICSLAAINRLMACNEIEFP